MYRYSEFDRRLVRDRVDRFRDQVRRRINGTLTEDEFKPFRLMNGLYLQLHAYMLRIAIPYGTLDSRQLRQLAYIAERWDKGYGHFTTRQNIQFNWPRLQDVPDILDALADADMHAIQTSGNCIRNVTADHFAGAAADEVRDPRPVAELIRQWSSDHPEFAFLPRKFKIAVTGSRVDRAVTRAHDIGLRTLRNDAGATGFEVIVGGGLGRTPVIGTVIREFLPESDLLPLSLEAILHVYNAIGRRDNKYKARIKITVRENGIETIREMVEQRFREIKPEFRGFDQRLLREIEEAFASPQFVDAPTGRFESGLESDPDFRSFAATNLHPHKHPDYSIVSVSLKAHGKTPGDATSDQMRTLADLAEHFGHDELRISHEQNVVLPPCPQERYSNRLRQARPDRSGNREYRPDFRHHCLPWHGLLCPGDRPVHPDRQGDFRSPQGTGTRDRPHEDQDLRLHQCVRSSSRRTYRNTRARSGRCRELPGSR